MHLSIWFSKKLFYGFFCLSYLNDKILKGLDTGVMTDVILIDFQKVFDTIDHDVLLQKLYAIAFSKHIINWFKSYLSNRSFLVDFGNNFSQPASISCGVSQGSVLGPLLFLTLVTSCQMSSLSVRRWFMFGLST